MTNDTVKPEVGKGQPKEKNEKKTIKMCASYFREIFDEYKKITFFKNHSSIYNFVQFKIILKVLDLHCFHQICFPVYLNQL